jgi:hypothetical protein
MEELEGAVPHLDQHEGLEQLEYPDEDEHGRSRWPAI